MRRARSTLLGSFGSAWSGFLFLLRTQRNMRIHVAAVPVVLVCGLWLQPPRWEWAILVLCAGMVLACEALNTAIEVVVDLLSPEWSEQARIAKDTAAAGVLLAAITAAVVGGLLLGGAAVDRWNAKKIAGVRTTTFPAAMVAGVGGRPQLRWPAGTALATPGSQLEAATTSTRL